MGVEIGVGWYIASVIVMGAVSAYLSKKQMDALQDSLSDTGESSGTQIKSNTRGTDAPLKVIYGTMRVGGNNVYVSTLGNKDKQLYYVHTLGEGEIEGIQVDGDGNPYIWFNGDLVQPKFNNYYWYDEKTGTNDQVADTLVTTAIPAFTDTMRNTAYVGWHLKFNENLYRGIPEIHYLVKGMKIYNPKTEVTEWSDNPAIALYNYLTNERYGAGISSADLDTNSFIDAIDYCDTKDFNINMVIDPASANVWEGITNILGLFRGSLNYWNGKYSLKFRDLNEESSVFTIEDEHIYQDSAGKAMVSLSDPGYYEIPKGITVSYINAFENLYVDESFVIGEEVGVLKSYTAIGCTSKQQAGVMGTYHLERAQLSRSIAGRFRDDAITLEPNDIVTFNSTALNIADQTMRVSSAVYTNLGFIDLVLEYEDESLYDDTYNISADSIYNTTLPDPTLPSLLESATITEVIYTQRLRTFSKLEIGFTVPDETWFKYVEVWMGVDDNDVDNFTHQFNTTDDFTIDPVEEGSTYYIALRTVNEWGTKQTIANANKVNKLIIGKSATAPDSLTYLNGGAGDGSISLRSVKLLDPDIEIYEFRMGDQWSGGIFLSAKRSPHEELDLVKPGTYTFWCNTKGTNGLYGDTPVSTTVTVAIPKGWSAYKNWTDDYLDTTASQIFTNVEHLIYSADDYLKCSHDTGYEDSTSVDSILNGYYISEEYDTGIVAESYYVYVDTEFVTVGAGTTWGDLFSDSTSTTWADVNASSRTWQEMFELSEAPAVVIRVWYKALPGDPWSYIENAQILASVITARYFKVEIEITDPATNVNAYVRNYTLELYN